MNPCNSRQIEEKWVLPKEEWQNVAEYILFLKQSKAYDYVKPYCSDKCVLDYGCGTGYGVMTISEHAKKVIAVDIDKKKIEYCREKYQKVNVSFTQVKAEYPLPYNNESFDIIISFQVIEHLPEVQRYLYEMKRLLKDQGSLIITTPNRFYRLFPFERPWNPEHRREYSYRTLDHELRRSFNEVRILGVHGNDKVDSIERKRVYRSPVKHLLGIMLPKSVISSIRARRHKGENNTVDKKQLIAGDTLVREVSLTDFDVAEYDSKCLDLMAVCQK